MSDNTDGTARRRTTLAIVSAVVVLATVALVAISTARGRPAMRPLGVALAVPESPRAVGPVWYWLEHAKDGSALVRTGPSREIIARAPRIVGFSVGDGALAWIANERGRYRLLRGNAGAERPTELWSSTETADGVWTDGRRTAWLVKPAPPRTSARALPPVGPTTEVWLHDGQAGKPIAVLAEGFREGRVVGAFQERLYVCGLRAEGIPISVIYEVPRQGPARRVAAEYGRISTLMRDGDLLWTAPSRESNSLLTACVRRMDLRSGATETLADWLPAQATLYLMRDRLILCAGLTETAWRVDAARKSGNPIAVPGDYWPLAASDQGLLAVLRRKTPGRVAVWLVQVP